MVIGLMVALSLLMSPLTPFSEAKLCPTEMVMRSWIQPIYPKNAVKKGIEGKVRMEAFVASNGKVKKVNTVAGDDELAKAAKDALKKWAFQPCVVDGEPAEVSVPLEFAFHTKTWNVTVSGAQEPPPATKPSEVTGIRPPLRVRVSAGVTASNIRYLVRPTYPERARTFGIQDAVVLHVLIGRDGGVKVLDVRAGPAELVPEAINVLQQWRYTPYSLNGVPVEVDTTVTINFTLDH